MKIKAVKKRLTTNYLDHNHLTYVADKRAVDDTIVGKESVTETVKKYSESHTRDVPLKTSLLICLVQE